jgi:hypothetical protein
MTAVIPGNGVCVPHFFSGGSKMAYGEAEYILAFQDNILKGNGNFLSGRRNFRLESLIDNILIHRVKKSF